MTHYARERWRGFPTARLLVRDQTCTAEGCTRPIHARRLCVTHYHRDYKLRHPQGPAGQAECSADNCAQPVTARGLCHRHWRHQRNLGFPVAARIRQPQPATCSVPGCPDRARTKGMCGMHYQRTRRNGDPLTVQRIRSRPVKESR
jgi:hypothetical protein